MLRLLVYGGGSPFTVHLARALAATELRDDVEMLLVGRTTSNTRDVAAYIDADLVGGAGRLRARGDLSLPEALGRCDVVLHQARFGGHDGRRADERLAETLGVAADETMGPAGLRNSIRIAKATQELGDAVTAHSCSSVPLIVLANPLPVTVSLLAAIVPNPVHGCCEVPVQMAAGSPTSDVAPGSQPPFSLVGLNHRSFLVPSTPFEDQGTGWAYPSWTSAREARALGAIPSKQFVELRRARPSTDTSRARSVATMSRQAAQDIRKLKQTSSGLSARPAVWYEQAAVPLITALASWTPRWMPTTQVRRGAPDLAHERFVWIDGDQQEAAASAPSTPEVVTTWSRRFDEHQIAVDAAVLEPSTSNIAEALESDPLIPTPRQGAPLVASSLLREEAAIS